MSLSTASALEAREVVDRIVQENGFLPESTLGSMSPEVRKQVEDALLAKDKKIGSTVLTLAKNLYTSNARFVFELLQNADDNQYSEGRDPFVSFRLYHDRLVVDCNEQGFSEDNLRAICDIGRSSKASSQGYIGEKGIGFKSVFMAAYKVHIQSGNLFFSFEHRKGDSGIGMDHTRMTLFLHENEDAERMRRDREDIRQQFRELEPAVLLFVRRLRCIDIAFYDEHDEQEWATRLSRRLSEQSNRVILAKRVTDTEDVEDVVEESHLYYLTEYMASDVARHEGRDPDGTAGPVSQKSKIVLAFPVTAESVPIIKQQKVFAFLPMKKMGFNFIIQADFVTQANREDVVTTSARNKDLVRGMTDAMMEAIEQFLEHEALQYTWMRYLPRPGTHHWDPFWNTLVESIMERLKSKRVMRTRGKRVLRRIGDMRHRVGSHNDCHGNPLFPDLDPELYLSDSYAQGDIETLMVFGLRKMFFAEIVEMARRDLAESDPPSTLRSQWTDEDWHSRASQLLLSPFEKKWANQIAEVRQLDIIPLKDGSWTRADLGDIFYGTIGGISIPRDLGLRIVDPNATKNERRVDLFNALGVQTADVSMVRSRILAMHHESHERPIDFRDALWHLVFLYLTHESRSEEENAGNLVVYDHRNRPRRPLEHDLYILDDHPYGAQSLLGTGPMVNFGASFVDSRYFRDAPGPSGLGFTWFEWMHEYVGVRRNIRMLERGGTSLSAECWHIATHQNHKFLEFLKHVWPTQGDAVAGSSNAIQLLRGVPVSCTNGEKAIMRESYMPLQELRRVQSRFADSDILPFLDISSSDDASLHSEWAFLLNDIGVMYEDDLEFRLHLYHAFIERMGEHLTEKDVSRLFALCRYIEAWCIGSDDQTTREKVFEEFNCNGFVLAVPSWEDGFIECEWVELKNCLWEAPADFTARYPLKALYSRAGVDVEGDDSMRQFFQRTLRIPDISHEHIVEELEYMDEQPDADTVGNLYRLLQGMCESDPSIASSLQNPFEKCSLVYAEIRGSSDWYSPSQCLWSSTTSIEGKVAIKDQYAEFEKLFTSVLGVPSVSLTMVYDSLMDAATGGATTERVKQLLLDFNTLLRNETKPPSPERLLQRRIFPVKFPSGATLCLRETEFFIADRDDLFAAFGDRVRCLDFPLGDVCRLRPFIAWAGLETRYLSRCVEEVSRVQDGVEVPLRDPMRDIKYKAYGLLRIAAKYESPRFLADPQALYGLLRTTETVEAEGLSSRWALCQDSEVHEHEISTSYLHIEERGGALRVYVPRDQHQWGNCFFDVLPRRLLSWMMAPQESAEAPAGSFDEAAVNVVTAILNCDVSAVPALLTAKGVPDNTEVEEEPLAVPEAASPPARPAHGGNPHALSPWSRDAPSSVFTPDSLSSPGNGDAGYATPPTDSGDYGPAGHGAEPSPSELLSAARQAGSREEYKRLLESVVAMAERVARRDYSTGLMASFYGLTLGDDGVFACESARHHLSNDEDRNLKVGAAGELFVYVFLSSLALPYFGRENWRSTIRHLAAAHPRYSDLTSWDGRETTDFVYDDVRGVFTALLISKGHLSGSQWEGKAPRYYIEVKASLDRRETPFHVSQDQAERMLRTTNGSSGSDNQGEVYVIFRVFNLGTGSTGLEIYVDPEEQRRTGKLKFMTTAQYTVVPGAGF